MKKINLRQVMYLILGMAFVLVEYLRATMTGAVWKPAANFVGILTELLILSNMDLKKIRKSVAAVATLVTAIGIVAACILFKSHVGEWSLAQINTGVINVGLLILIWSVLFEEFLITKTRKIKSDPLFGLFFLIAVLSVISRSSAWWPVWFLFVFGAYYLTDIKDSRSLKKGLTRGIIAGFFILQSFAFLFRPFDALRYAGPYPNCNDTALFYVCVYVCILTELGNCYREKVSKQIKLVLYVLAASMWSFMLYTQCRTIWGTAFVITVIYGVAELIKNRKAGVIGALKQGVLFGVVALCMIPLVYIPVRYLPCVHPHPIWYEGEYRLSAVHSFDPIDSPKFTSYEELKSSALGRLIFKKVNPGEEPKGFAPFTGEPKYVTIGQNGADMTNSMLVRKEIFKAYLKEFNLIGHHPDDVKFVYGSGNPVWHAQNLWIQIGYDFGVLAFAAAVILSVLILIRLVKNVLKGDSIYSLFALLVYVIFFLYGTMEIVWKPGQLIFALAFLVMHPCFKNTDEEKERAVS
ncbi:MAG: hypothetical protein K6F84_02310 [Lachnospiraceae bacterium]|nr:hypothetical protein [Lachnospiraceae bacterium]